MMGETLQGTTGANECVGVVVVGVVSRLPHLMFKLKAVFDAALTL